MYHLLLAALSEYPIDIRSIWLLSDTSETSS
jgi:hypothetical protein